MRRGWPRWLECRPTWRGRASRPATAQHAASSSSNGYRSCTGSKRPAMSTPPSTRCGAVGVDFLVTLGDSWPVVRSIGLTRGLSIGGCDRSIRSGQSRDRARLDAASSAATITGWICRRVGPQSMASDWRVLPVPLQQARLRRLRIGLERGASACRLLRTRLLAVRPRALCRAAGASKAAAVRSLDRAGVPARRTDQRRHNRYSTWVAATDRFFWRLANEWPSTTLAGCDPSAEAVAHANAAGLQGLARHRVEPAD